MRIDMHTSDREFGRPMKKQANEVDVTGIDNERPSLGDMMLEDKT